MKTFIVTAHIELTSKLKPIPPQEPVKTGLIRMEIKADSEEEAHTKARRFIHNKTAIVIDTCNTKPEQEDKPPANPTDDPWGPFRDIFSNWKAGSV